MNALHILGYKLAHDGTSYTYAWKNRRHRKSELPTPRISKDEASDKRTNV